MSSSPSPSSKGPGVGFTYPPQPVSWTTRDALLFAASIGCKSSEPQFLYELSPNFAVFPTYSIILPFKGTATDVIDFYAKQSATPIPGVPKLDPRRVVDGQREIRFLKPLPRSSEGRKFEVRSSVVGVYDKGKVGTVVETKNELVDVQSGEVYTVAIGSGFFLGQGGWGGPKGGKTVNYPPPEGRAPDARHVLQLSEEAAALYRLNGDYNPLHIDPEPGKKMGFGGVIMHGLFTWNSAAHALLQELGGSDPKNFKHYQARFASPVKPGQKITTEAWRMGNKDSEGFEEIRFVTKADGKVVLSNGKALIRVVQNGGSKL